MMLSSVILMMPYDWRRIMKRIALMLILGSLLFLDGGASAAPKKDDTNGSYKLIFKGCYRGTGTATVNPNFVSIKGKDLTDEHGNAVDFDVKKLPVENHRFRGRVNVGQGVVIISGRVDPSGGALKKARINCTFTAEGAGFGRVVGEHN